MQYSPVISRVLAIHVLCTSIYVFVHSHTIPIIKIIKRMVADLLFFLKEILDKLGETLLLSQTRDFITSVKIKIIWPSQDF